MTFFGTNMYVVIIIAHSLQMSSPCLGLASAGHWPRGDKYDGATQCVVEFGMTNCNFAKSTFRLF